MGNIDSIEVDIKVELGSSMVPIHQMLRMGRGAVIELAATEHDLMRIYANEAHIANGQVMVDGAKLSVQVLEKVVVI